MGRRGEHGLRIAQRLNASEYRPRDEDMVGEANENLHLCPGSLQMKLRRCAT